MKSEQQGTPMLDRLKETFTGLAANAQAAARLAAKQAERTKLTTMTLPALYRELGKDIHATGRYRDQFTGEFAKADELKQKIEAIRQSEPEKDGESKTFTDRAKETAGKARDVALGKKLEGDLNSAWRKLGQAAFEKLGSDSGPPQLIAPIEDSHKRLATLDTEIQAIESNAASGVLTPRRLLLGTGACVVLVLVFGAWVLLGAGATTSPERAYAKISEAATSGDFEYVWDHIDKQSQGRMSLLMPLAAAFSDVSEEKRRELKQAAEQAGTPEGAKRLFVLVAAENREKFAQEWIGVVRSAKRDGDKAELQVALESGDKKRIPMIWEDDVWKVQIPFPSEERQKHAASRREAKTVAAKENTTSTAPDEKRFTVNGVGFDAHPGHGAFGRTTDWAATEHWRIYDLGSRDEAGFEDAKYFFFDGNLARIEVRYSGEQIAEKGGFRAFVSQVMEEYPPSKRGDSGVVGNDTGETMYDFDDGGPHGRCLRLEIMLSEERGAVLEAYDQRFSDRLYEFDRSRTQPKAEVEGEDEAPPEE